MWANSSVVDLDSDFVSSGRGNLNIFKSEGLSSFPGNSSLAGDGLDKKSWLIPFENESVISVQTRLLSQEVGYGGVASEGTNLSYCIRHCAVV